MAGMMIMGMAPKRAAVVVLITGGTAAVAKFAGDTLGDRLFLQTAAEAASNPRDADERKMIQLYRGLAVGAGALLIGKVLWRYTKPVAVGIAAGGVVSGLDRIFTVYGVKRTVTNLFRASNNQIPALAANAVPEYNAGALRLPAGSGNVNGPMVIRDTVRMTG